MKVLARRHSVLPGFGLTMGFTVLYLSLIVFIPLSALFLKCSDLGWPGFWETITAPRVIAAYQLTFGAALTAAVINSVCGFGVAWSLVRYRFPGKRFVDAIIDLPFAMPTAVSGIALTTLTAPNGWIGRLTAPLGLKIAFTPLGVMITLIFIGLPFVVRTLQPVLKDLDVEIEEAAASLGASRFRTFQHVIMPVVLPSLMTGFTLALARGLGEYGSVVFISGNMPMKTEIAPLLIVSKLEQYDYEGATAIAVVLLVASFVLLFLINMLQRWSGRRHMRGV